MVSTNETGVSPFVFKSKETPTYPGWQSLTLHFHCPAATSRASTSPLPVPSTSRSSQPSSSSAKKKIQEVIWRQQHKAKLQSLKIGIHSPCSRAVPTSCRCNRGRGGHASPRLPPRPAPTGCQRTRSAAARALRPKPAHVEKKKRVSELQGPSC